MKEHCFYCGHKICRSKDAALFSKQMFADVHQALLTIRTYKHTQSVWYILCSQGCDYRTKLFKVMIHFGWRMQCTFFANVGTHLNKYILQQSTRPLRMYFFSIFYEWKGLWLHFNFSTLNLPFSESRSCWSTNINLVWLGFSQICINIFGHIYEMEKKFLWKYEWKKTRISFFWPWLLHSL